MYLHTTLANCKKEERFTGLCTYLYLFVCKYQLCFYFFQTRNSFHDMYCLRKTVSNRCEKQRKKKSMSLIRNKFCYLLSLPTTITTTIMLVVLRHDIWKRRRIWRFSANSFATCSSKSQHRRRITMLAKRSKTSLSIKNRLLLSLVL